MFQIEVHPFYNIQPKIQSNQFWHVISTELQIINFYYKNNFFLKFGLNFNNLQNTLKPILLKKADFNYDELFEWVKNHSDTPEDEHEAFVIDAYFEINDKFPNASIFRMAIQQNFYYVYCNRQIMYAQTQLKKYCGKDFLFS